MGGGNHADPGLLQMALPLIPRLGYHHPTCSSCSGRTPDSRR
jgi:hypothetical protein